MYALVEFAGKQFKVEEGAQIKVPYLTEKIGSKVFYVEKDTDDGLVEISLQYNNCQWSYFLTYVAY